MIPKVIHYVWVGRKEWGALQQRCMDSWKKHLPDYQLKLWNERTVPPDIQAQPYVRAMYQQGKWAFVADYIRFWALEQEGGVYLDTDTEVLKSFDPLLAHEVFFGKTKDGYVAAGVIGARAHHPCIRDILRAYEENRFPDMIRTSPQVVTEALRKNNYPDVTVYDYHYFNPCDDGERCTAQRLALAYTKNHWAESWVPFAGVRKVARRLGLGWVKRRLVGGK